MNLCIQYALVLELREKYFDREEFEKEYRFYRESLGLCDSRPVRMVFAESKMKEIWDEWDGDRPVMVGQMIKCSSCKITFRSNPKTKG